MASERAVSAVERGNDSLTMLCHGQKDSEMAVSEGDEMIEGGQSCYRVSVLSGSLEVSARLKNADDLENSHEGS